MLRTPFAWGFASLALGLLAPLGASATVVKAMTLEEKTHSSPVVVRAIVERVESQWEVPDASIETMITVRVLECIKGDAAIGSHLIVRQGGGKIDDLVQTAPGLSTYEPGEEAVLFLEPLGAYLVEIGIGIGKYGVELKDGEPWVTHVPNVAEARFASDGRHVSIQQAQPMKPQPLSAFLKLVRSYARGIPADTKLPNKAFKTRVLERIEAKQ
jgi:hypothetical protein